ncbi:MAG: peptidoglycan DD-metalloendopeptidase family protein [Deltaproteobacteria bacterium]|jgi:murein DD-endopeptidase MepM/ murein hydrolase activator NlpD|nr:peptidoglycan DD-metalloendopeptidase family protein [Deltaproteobacteria bacterium]
MQRNTKEKYQRSRNLQFKNWDYDSMPPPLFYRKPPKSFLPGKKTAQSYLLAKIIKEFAAAVSDLFYFILIFCFKSKIFLAVIIIFIVSASYFYFSPDKTRQMALEESNVLLNLTNSIEIPTLKPQQPTSAAVFAGKGDTLNSILKKFGIPNKEIANIQKASTKAHIQTKKQLKTVKEKGKMITKEIEVEVPIKTANVKAPIKLGISIGDLIELNLTNSELDLSFHNKDGLITVRRNSNQQYLVEKVAVSRVAKEVIAQGQIITNFTDAAKQVGLTNATIDNLVDLFSTRINFSKGLQYGDKFTVIVSSSQLEDGRVLRENDILAAAISSNGKDYMAIRYVGTDGKIRYFDENGSIIGNYFLRYPVKFSRISSSVSDARFHPVLKIKRPHKGVDFAAPIGTPVRASGNGTIKSAGRDKSRGIYVEIYHNKRYQTKYFHLSKIAKGIKNGIRIKRGEIIGAVGSTGLSTGPHLHYEFWDNGRYVNPLKIKLPTLDGVERDNKIDASYFNKVVFTLDNYQSFKDLTLNY